MSSLVKKHKPKNLYAIWKNGTIGKVLLVTTENYRTEYYIHWPDEPKPRYYPYGPEDIIDGNLKIVKGDLETIKVLYGNKT